MKTFVILMALCAVPAYAQNQIEKFLPESGTHSPTTLFEPFDDSYGCRSSLPRPWACEDFSVNGVGQGSFLSLRRLRARYLLAAPHGWFDYGTANIAASIFSNRQPAYGPQWSQLIAHSFRGNAPSGLAHNVNRPSLLDDDSCVVTPELETSRLVWEAYREHLDRLVKRPALYFELHGQSQAGLEDTIEVASYGIDSTEAKQIRRIMREELGGIGLAHIRFKIEPIDKIFFNAGQTKRCGSIAHIAPSPSLHYELPFQLRDSAKAQLKTAQLLRRVLLRLTREVFP